MIQVDNLHYRYPPVHPGSEWQTVLDSISFQVQKGECMAITGPNNAGKSTLCLAISGLAPRLTGGHISGSIRVAGQDVQNHPPGALAGTLGLVFDDPAGQLFQPTVEEDIAWGLENLRTPPEDIGPRIEWVLGRVGLADIPRHQPSQTLSWGQQKRLALAAALALRPRVLILDQPTGGLAPRGQRRMIEVLEDLRRRESLTLLFSARNPDVIIRLADRMFILDNGHVVKSGTPDELYPEMGREAYPGLEQPPASLFVAVAGRERAIDQPCLTVNDVLEAVQPYTLSNVRSPTFEPLPRSEDPTALEIKDLHFAYEPGRPVLRGLDVTIPTGQFVALLGDNGAGKTTLARHLIGLLRPEKGSIWLQGEETAERSVGSLSHQVGLAFQHPEQQMFSTTVREEVAFGPRNLGMKGDALNDVISDTLRTFKVSHLADHPPAILSFSERRLVALASIAAMRTPIIVLDESTLGLDKENQTCVMNWLTGYHKKGGTVLLITHDVELAARHAERVLVLREGKIAADGPAREVFTQTELLASAGLTPPFAVQFAQGLDRPGLAADLTPEGAARAWLGVVT